MLTGRAIHLITINTRTGNSEELQSLFFGENGDLIIMNATIDTTNNPIVMPNIRL
jgi:hypothetical protein